VPRCGASADSSVSDKIPADWKGIIRFAFVAAIYLLAPTSANAETAATLSAFEASIRMSSPSLSPIDPVGLLLSFLVVMPVSAYRNTSPPNCNGLLASATFVAQV
jgi:hypothetical protein